MIRTKRPITANLNLIRDIAWRFHFTTGIEWEELYAEGCLSYIQSEAKDVHQRSQSKFETWITSCIKKHLILFCANHQHACFPESLDRVSSGRPASPYDLASFRELMASSKDVQEIFDLILESPEIYANLPPKKARGRIKNELRDFGWTWPRIWNGFREVKACLSQT